jgi:hypothetical protein
VGSTETTVRCSECDALLDESADLAPESRSPCAFCGSTGRRFELRIESSVTVRSSLDTKAKDESGRWFQKQRVGASFYRLTGTWHRFHRVIDRRDNRYVERIHDEETGETVRDVDEPLTDHTGHGSARRP